jgi:tetratricopeptide (TPR) repeat protein
MKHERPQDDRLPQTPASETDGTEPLTDRKVPPLQPPVTLAANRLLRLVVFLCVLIIGSGSAVLWMVFRGESHPESQQADQASLTEDPRRTYLGPWQNIRPEVAYVGSEACSSCHAKIAESYGRHPMGRSLMPTARIAAQQRYDPASHNPFEAAQSVFRVDRQGERVWQRQTRIDAAGKPIFRKDVEIHYVIGSGNHGRSYLTSKEDYLFQSGISWFGQKQRWDISPGFASEDLWNRPVIAECLHCHANRARLWPGRVNRYQEPIFLGHAIGCERCHGAGEAHVNDPGRFHPVADAGAWKLQANVDKIDATIVNPGKLAWELREAVCQQCHLEGEARVLRRGRELYDYRPGLPLEAFWSIFVAAGASGEDNKAVNHVEQMYSSACFQRSQADRKLGCISCHNPHERVESQHRAAYYRDRCLHCHASGDQNVAGKLCCAQALSQRLKSHGNNCVACHMPPYPSSDIAHTASTDHRIVRRPGAVERIVTGRAVFPLMSFHRGQVKSHDRELSRDLALAMSRWIVKKPDQRHYAAQVVSLLDDALVNDRHDLPAWEGKARALFLLARHAEGLAAAEAMLAKVPDDEAALELAGRFAQDLGLLEPALKYWRSAVHANPWMPSYRANLTRLLAVKEDWDELQSSSRIWLELDPASVDAGIHWITCLARSGAGNAARAEFARIEALEPANLNQLRTWFAQLVK